MKCFPIFLFAIVLIGQFPDSALAADQKASPQDENPPKVYPPIVTETNGELVELRIRSLSGGPAEDIYKKTAAYLSLPDFERIPARLLPQVFTKRFPVGMKREELLQELRKVRRQHLCDTDLHDIESAIDETGNSRPGPVRFVVKTYTRSAWTKEGKTVVEEDAIGVNSLIITFGFSKTGEIEDYSAWLSQETI